MGDVSVFRRGFLLENMTLQESRSGFAVRTMGDHIKRVIPNQDIHVNIEL